MNKPPEKIELLLLKLIKNCERESLSGDFAEMYGRIFKRKGIFYAILWYVIHIIKLIPSFMRNLLIRSLAMTGNYFKIAFRNIIRNKNYAFINLTGLALGMTCSIIILLYVKYELSYDSYHENYYRIHRVAAPFSAAISSAPLGPALQEEFPEIEETVRIYAPKIWKDRELVNANQKSFYTDRFFFADPSLFKIFTFTLIKGDPQTVLTDLNSVVITESTAIKYFGAADPIGRVITYENEIELTITGIIKDMPFNSHFRFDFVARLDNYYSKIDKDWENRWGNSAFVTYILLPPGFNTSVITERIPDVIKKHTGRENGDDYFIQSLEEIHLHSKLGKEIDKNGDIRKVRVFSAIAVLILVIACLNYINLATAQASIRAKEIGLRKVAGAKRLQLVRQFLGESVLISTLAFAAALLLVHLMLPLCRDHFEMYFDTGPLTNLNNMIVFLSITVLTGVFSGSFPAFILSSYNPGAALKNYVLRSVNRFTIRNFLVVFQLMISISLIICTWTIYQQNEFIENSEKGFDYEQIIVLQTGRMENVKSKVRVLEDEFRNIPGVLNVTASVRTPGRRPFWRNIRLVPSNREERENMSIQFLATDYDFIDTYKMKLLAGRDFSRLHPEDEETTYILNETAVKMFGFSTPDEAIGRQIIQSNRTGKIIGVVRDYHFVSMHTEIAPMIMNIFPENLYTVSVRINTDNITRTIDTMGKSWNTIYPDMPFDFFFLDEAYSDYYHSDIKTGRLISTFTFISIFITCLGLFGLISFSADRRKKEIGVRKVLGASVSMICRLMINDYFKWIIIANIISWPIAYYVTDIWLNNFAYSIDNSLSVYVSSGLLTLLLVILTIGFRSLKAAKESPVRSLRYE